MIHTRVVVCCCVVGLVRFATSKEASNLLVFFVKKNRVSRVAILLTASHMEIPDDANHNTWWSPSLLFGNLDDVDRRYLSGCVISNGL